jgi:hypothetical protein
MDKSQIINLLITMVVTIVTTAIVTRLSLNKGSLGVASTLKTRFTAKLKAYTILIFLLVVVICLTAWMYRYFSEPNQPPVSRLDVGFIFVISIATCMASYFVGYTIGHIITLTGLERHQREQALLRAHEEAQLEALKPAIEHLQETIRLAREDRPKDHPIQPDDKPS